MHLNHPRVGDIYVCRNQLNVPHAPHAVGQHLLIYHAEPGSDSERALEELRALSMRELDVSAGAWDCR